MTNWLVVIAYITLTLGATFLALNLLSWMLEGIGKLLEAYLQ